LQKEINGLKKIPAQLSAKKIIANSKTNACKILPVEFGNSKFILFFKRQKAIVAAFIATGNFSDENIHTIRKALKDFYFMLKVFQKYEAAGSGIRVKKTEMYYYKLLREMGSFCDTCAAINLLKSHLVKQPDMHNQQLLQQIKKTWLKEKQLLKKALVKKLVEGGLPLP